MIMDSYSFARSEARIRVGREPSCVNTLILQQTLLVSRITSQIRCIRLLKFKLSMMMKHYLQEATYVSGSVHSVCMSLARTVNKC